MGSDVSRIGIDVLRSTLLANLRRCLYLLFLACDTHGAVADGAMRAPLWVDSRRRRLTA